MMVSLSGVHGAGSSATAQCSALHPFKWCKHTGMLKAARPVYLQLCTTRLPTALCDSAGALVTCLAVLVTQSLERRELAGWISQMQLAWVECKEALLQGLERR